ncbi:hypothetical protein GCM10009624_29710 [Gordonia sinesedis]
MTFSDIVLLTVFLVAMVLPSAFAVYRVHARGDLPLVPFGFDDDIGRTDPGPTQIDPVEPPIPPSLIR